MEIFSIFRKRKTLSKPWSKYYSDDKIDIPNISLYEQILQTARKYPNNISYKYFGKKVLYKKFIKQIDKTACSFKNLGIKKGDIVTICLPNIPEVIISFYALNKLGAIANMIHPLSAEEEIKESIIATKSNYLIMIDICLEKIKDNYDDLKKIIIVSASDSMNILLKLGYKIINIKNKKGYPKNKIFISWKKFISKYYSKIEINEKCGKDTRAVILHSGGTSGKPKHVVLQNRAFILAAIQEKIALKNLKPGDSCFAVMPNFHGFGLSVCMHTPLYIGCYPILIPQFNSKKFNMLVNKEKPNVIIGVPTLYESFISGEVKDLSFLKYVICGGDSLNKDLEERINIYLKEHNSNITLSQGYGMTEALAAVCLGVDDIKKAGSIGIPLPGNYIKIIDPVTRKTNPFNEIGEICINTKGLMLEYLNNESETNEALQIHDDGHIWLHTGDLGYMDSDGFIFYKGRSKRMIITSGYNVYPSYIEEVIQSHPAVLQCSIVAMPHPYKQEVPKAFIVLKDGFQGLFIKNEIKEYCKKNLAKYMIPYKFVYRKKLPKTKLGKIDFKKLEGEDDD